MAEKGRSALKTERTATYKVGVKKGTTVNAVYNLMESVIDSAYNKVDDIIAGTGTKTFNTTGTATDYAVTDTEVATNDFLNGKPFFVIFNVDSGVNATIQFNALTALSIQMVSKDGKASSVVNDLKANVVYVMIKPVGLNEIFIRQAGVSIDDVTPSTSKVWSSEKTDNEIKASRPLLLKAIDGSGGAGSTYNISIPSVTTGIQIENAFTWITFDTNPVNGTLLLINGFLIIVALVYDYNDQLIKTGMLKSNRPYLCKFNSATGELWINYISEINDTATNTNEVWSSEKTEDRAIKTLVKVEATYVAGGNFSCSIPHITSLADLENYFYVFVFNQAFSVTGTITVNSLPPINIKGVSILDRDGEANSPYLLSYDGLNFKLRTEHRNYDIRKYFHDGSEFQALIEYIDLGAGKGLQFFTGITDESKAYRFYADTFFPKTNHLSIHPPTVTLPAGGIGGVSAHTANPIIIAELPTSLNNAYPSGGKIITPNSFEEEFPPFKMQSLINGAVITFGLKDGFLGKIDIGTATSRTINFVSTGVTGNVEVAKGQLIIKGDNSCDITFQYDGNPAEVMTDDGSGNPVTVSVSSPTPYKEAIVDYFLDRSRSIKLFISVKLFS